MKKKRFYYLFYIQFLGFRYHGWQKQKDVKTVQEMVDKTFRFIFKHENFKTIGAGRTDMMVSANRFAFELFVWEEIEDEDSFLAYFNHNLPGDIRGVSLEKVDEKFNVIQDAKRKEYHYVFSYGHKIHPFVAPNLVAFEGELDIELMKKGAKLFEGKHLFNRYVCRPSLHTVFDRHIDYCELTQNNIYSGTYYPENSFVLKIRGKGFLRYQIRIMMGVLVELGRGTIGLDEIKNSLKGEDKAPFDTIAPSSGLILHDIFYL